jgi:hypothetical protein
MIEVETVSSLPDDKLKQMHQTLLSMKQSRQQTKHNKRTKKLKINFNQSHNAHFNQLVEAVEAELKQRKL